MVKCLHKVFMAFVNVIFQVLTILGETGSEGSHFIPEPRNFAEVIRLLEYINKYRLK